MENELQPEKLKKVKMQVIRKPFQRTCQDGCDGNSEQGQEAASWPREPAGQACGTGFLYKVQSTKGTRF